MEKTIIIISGVSNQGKTTSINALFTELEIKGKVIEKTVWGKEIEGIIELENKRIGLYSFGDPYSPQEKKLQELIAKNCDIIVTASRTRGRTKGLIHNLAREHKYKMIFTSNYYAFSCKEELFCKKLNTVFATSLVKLIETII